jgi:hypothetical protein
MEPKLLVRRPSKSAGKPIRAPRRSTARERIIAALELGERCRFFRELAHRGRS